MPKTRLAASHWVAVREWMIQLWRAVLPKGLEEEERPRARVFLIILCLALGLSLLSAVDALDKSLTTLALANVLDLGATGLLLFAYRHAGPRGRQRTVRAFIGFFAVTLASGVVLVSPPDFTVLCFLFVLPLVAALMLPAAEVKWWTLVSVATGTVAVFAASNGWHSSQRDLSPASTHLLNFLGSMVCDLALLLAMAADRGRAIARIREVERAKRAFFANLGHDIRTPMNGVLGMADALLTRPLRPEDTEMVEAIRSSGAMLLSLLDEMLDLSKLEAGQLVLRPEPNELRAPFRELEALWRQVASRKGLELSVWVEPSLPAGARFDGVRVRQVLNNLVSNALKFTPKGRVRVTVSAADTRLVVVVEDTGIGIEPEQQRRLFARFAQADDDAARAQQGTGLGLALSRQLAEAMGGQLELESVPGLGSRFRFSVPLVEAVPPPHARAPETALPLGLKVLVVDDNPINRLVAQRLLDKSGCEVRCVNDGQGALEAMAAQQFDVVLMDVHMPTMDGLEATRQLRQRGETQPIIGVSASGAEQDVEACRRAGMSDFLAKPMTSERLVATLLRHLGEKVRLGPAASVSRG